MKQAQFGVVIFMILSYLRAEYIACYITGRILELNVINCHSRMVFEPNIYMYI